MAVIPLSRVRRAKQTLTRRLAGEPGFVGAGISAGASGDPEILVMVEAPDSTVLSKVPAKVAGISVRTQVGGKPRKY